MRNHLLAVVVLLISLGRVAFPQYMTGVVLESQVIPLAEFSRAGIIRIAEKFVQEHRNSSFARLMLFTDAQFMSRYGAKFMDVGKVRVLPFSLPTSYDRWRQLYSSGGNVLEPMAEVLTRNGKAGVRIRYPGGSIERIVLHGGDPFLVLKDGQRCELLDYTFRGNVRETPPGGPYQQISLYLRTEAPLTEELGRGILMQLLDFRSENGLMVYLRNDAWFIEQTRFPIVWGFDANPAPPTREQYFASKEARCLWWQERELSCSIYHPKP